jgi:hypothetical protein
LITPQISATTRRWVAGAAVLAFALHALVPVGYMWAPLAGRVTVVACSDHDHDVVSMAAHHQHHHAGGVRSASNACPFALAGGAPLAAQVPALDARHHELVQARLPPVDHSIAPPIPLRYSAPRGPPAIA